LNWQWPGYVVGEAKARLVEGARAILFPCLWPEPLSTVAYEAYDRRRAVLTSDLGGMREIVFDRGTGRCLPAGDRARWKEAILELWKKPLLAAEWGVAGRRWLEQNVSPAAWNGVFSAMLSRVLARRPSPGSC
jgi:glycosyltransferase involved in cell wall biosynthesis